MAIKKSELYSSLWASCDELRGGMDASCHKGGLIEYATLVTLEDINATRDSEGDRMPSAGRMSMTIPGYNPSPVVFSEAGGSAQVAITSGENTVIYPSWRSITTTSSCAVFQEMIDRFLNKIGK